jgi:uncharacterized repeat protein (TIGR01451 family)
MPMDTGTTAVRLMLVACLGAFTAVPASAQDGVIYNPDCNDPDAHELACVEPTPAIIANAQQSGHEYYIGHAEPSVLFFSTSGASGHNMQWKFKLPATEPSSPTQDGAKVANFELYGTMWLGLALCDPNSNPFGACVAISDANNPNTAGAAFLELQFYPPGINCSNTQWCVNLHINTLQNNTPFQIANCLEPTTAAFVTTNGLPGGTQLLMNNGDEILVTITDTANGLRTDVSDLTTASTGFMVASGANGYRHNANQTNCATTAFDFHAMYATASPGQVVPWASLGPNVAMDFEIGHFELCGTSDCSTKPDGNDTDDTGCQTVRGIGGCFGQDNDHDGTPYQADWPDGTANHPASFIFSSPNDLGVGPMNATIADPSTYDQAYDQITFQTTESTTAPFYPFYSQAGTGAACRFNFGNDIPGTTTNDFGKATQYGTSIANPCFSAPDLTIAKSHSDPFTQGDGADTFTIKVKNVGGAATSGTVTVADALPASLTAVAMSGSGWSCNAGTATCTNASPLAAGASYSDITLTVSVAANAPVSVTNTVTVSGGGEGSNVAANDSAIDLVHIRQHTTTTLQPATADYHDTATLRATVAPSGAAGSVEFFVNGSSVGLGTYNSGTGVATFPYLVTLAAGSYSLEADFTRSDPLFLNSKGTLATGLSVTLEEDTLTYTGDTVIANGGTATLSGVLLEDGVTPIAGRTVHFTLGSGGSAQTCNGMTNGSGVAKCTISPVAQPLGPGLVGDSFVSDGFYRPASASGNTIMFAFLAAGADVIGDQSASIGSGVTFWGAQWSSLNGLSGGGAPDSFKGFASATFEPPACGSLWTTAPGNSANPPAAVPSYMGVVVSTTVAKTGATISGDVLSIVVVQTNGGYAANPGHAGTGTVVAQYCHR